MSQQFHNVGVWRITHQHDIPVNSTSPPSRTALSSVISTIFRFRFFRVVFINSVCEKTNKKKPRHKFKNSHHTSVDSKTDQRVPMSVNVSSKRWFKHVLRRDSNSFGSKDAEAGMPARCIKEIHGGGERGPEAGRCERSCAIVKWTPSALHSGRNCCSSNWNVHSQNGRDDKNQPFFHPWTVAMMSS